MVDTPKTLDTLVDDLDELWGGAIDATPEQIDDLVETFRTMVTSRFDGKDRVPRLSMSNIGDTCTRKLWYHMNDGTPHEEPLTPATRRKFFIGDVVELVLLWSAKLAGHTVEGEQRSLKHHGIPGSIDAIVDGVLVDAKSASGYGMRKFNGKLVDDDPFNYLGQLNGYALALGKTEGAFLVIDKVSGHIVLDRYEFDDEDRETWELDAAGKQEIVTKDAAPTRPSCCDSVEDGKAGNMKLCVKCSYCSYKWDCYTGLKGFLYSNGPRFFSTVVKRPQDHIPMLRKKVRRKEDNG